MKKFRIAFTAAIVVLFALNTNTAKAQGLHFRSGGIHIDVGHPHHGHGHYGHYRGGRRGHGYHGGYGYRGGYRHWGGHGVWHDTTHLDYHPGGYVRHYDHYDYVPGHYDVHHDGHWDHFGF